MTQMIYSLPKWRAMRWLVEPNDDVPAEIRQALVGTLFGANPIFIGGVVNSFAISVLCALKAQTSVFYVWAIAQGIICGARLLIVALANRAARRGLSTFTDLQLTLALFWAASVGAGAFASLVSGDWVLATLACVSAAAMVGGVCFRNYGAPRYVCAMILLTLGPMCPAALLSGQLVMGAVLLQIPAYAYAMTAAAFRLNEMLISTMKAQQEADKLARIDALTGLLNRNGLKSVQLFDNTSPRDADRSTAVFYLDLDLFKSVNDRHGHAAGDTVLQAVAARLRRVLRRSDQAARIGGDEFIALAYNIDEANAMLLADRLVNEISAAAYSLPGGATARLGVSIGVAFATHDDPSQTLDDVLAAADRALYEAKSNGKAQFRSFRRLEATVAA